MSHTPIAKMTLEQAYRGLRELEGLYRAKLNSMQSGRGLGFIKASFRVNKAKYEARIAQLKRQELEAREAEVLPYLVDPEDAAVEPREDHVVSDEVAPSCPTCRTGYGVTLGTLGNRTHYRCRDCGMEFS